MQLTARTTVALALAVLAFGVLVAVVPTAAVLPASSDRVWADQSIVLEPHDGPNGAYARVESDGTLRVDLAEPGVNVDARSVVADVFSVSNHGTTPTRVWLTHAAAGRVSFYVGGRHRIDGAARGVVLSPGERRSVSIRLHTDGTAPDAPLLRTVTVHAEPVSTTTTSTTTTTGPGSGSGSGSSGPTGTTPTTTTATTTATPPATTPDPNETVEVELDGSGVTDGDDPSTGGDDIAVVELSVGDLANESVGRGGPRAVIVPGGVGTGDGTGAGAGVDTPVDGVDGANGTRTVSFVNETVMLSGSRSLVGSLDAVDPERRIVKAVDIQVPESRADRPGTVRIRVAKSRFGDSDPTSARIGHLEDDGWQLLSTRVVEETSGYVVLSARTPGFSPFAVFAATEVRYEWTVDGETYVGEDVEFAFPTPGQKTVNLTVTDAFGQSDRTVYRILVNDVPSVAIDVPANATAGDPVVLRADVADEVGNVSATWTFPDGSQATGLAVERAFGPGEHVVLVTVEDDHGASTTVERTVVVHPTGGRAVIGPALRDVPIGVVVLLAALLAGLGWVARPRLPAAVLAWIRARWFVVTRRHTPRIVRFDTPSVDLAGRRFVIPTLTVEDPADDLRTVEITVRDGDGFEVGSTTVRTDGASSYVAEPQRVEPRSAVYVAAGEDYTVRVRATDADGGTAERRRVAEPDESALAVGDRRDQSDSRFAGSPAGD